MLAFPTTKSESFRTKIFKYVFNLFPAYRRGGGRVNFISADWYEVHIKISLNWATRNYVGSVFGGSIYAALDPVYMLQLIKILGDKYVVWDKAATINFIRPIRQTVFARFEMNAEMIYEIKQQIQQNNKYILELPVSFQDKNGLIYVTARKTLYIADKDYYKNKPKK